MARRVFPLDQPIHPARAIYAGAMGLLVAALTVLVGLVLAGVV